MPFVKTQFNTGEAVGILNGVPRHNHGYVTNEDAAAIETSGFFNEVAHVVNTGDQLTVSLDLDGTPAMRSYVMINNNGVITITASSATPIA